MSVTARRSELASTERAALSRLKAGPRGTRAISMLLGAALTEFSARGWRDTTVEHVLKTAGVSRATFYRYFSDLRDLLHVLAQTYIDEVTPIMAALYGSALSDPAGRDVAIDAYVRTYGLYAGIARIWAEEAPHDRTLMVMARRSSALPRTSFRAALEAQSEDADATFLVIYALTDRFPYHAFGAGSPHATPLEPDVVSATLKVILDGVARARRLMVRDRPSS